MGNKGLSIVIPVTERLNEPAALFDDYRRSLESTGLLLQFIFVLDGRFQDQREQFLALDGGPHRLEVVTFTRTFGESAALSQGFERAVHDLVMTLPAYQQVRSDYLPRLLEAMPDTDMVIARRWPRHDSALNRFSAKFFHAILRRMTHVPFRDLGCGVRLLRRIVVEEVIVYGDQHRFFPILADRRGFRVREIDLPQAEVEGGVRVYRPGVYVSRLLDLLGVFFVARFTKKPLRFFGMLGSVLLTAGTLTLVIAVLQRYLMDMALADRPLLLLGSLLLVVGVQLFALGLIGELIIFTHARDLREYAVAETVNMDDAQERQNLRPKA